MPHEDWEYVSPGDQINAADWNRMLEKVDRHDRRMRATGQGGFYGADWGGDIPDLPVQQLMVRITSDVVAPGSPNYGAPAVLLTGGGGSGATAHATVSGGVVTGLVLDSGGSGYTSAPTVVFLGNGIGAAGHTTISGGAVNSIVLDSGGSGYTVPGPNAHPQVFDGTQNLWVDDPSLNVPAMTVETYGDTTLRTGDRVLVFYDATSGKWLPAGTAGGSRLWAQITAVSGTAYAWTQQDPGPNGTFTPTPNGLSGTTSVTPAYEVNLNPGVPLPSYVRLWPGSKDATGAVLDYRFIGGGSGGGGALIKINNGTPNGDGTYDGTIELVSSSTLGLTAGTNVWFYDPNKPGALIPGAYFTASFVPGGNYTPMGQSARPLYVRDDFNLRVDLDNAGSPAAFINKLLFNHLDFVLAAGTRSQTASTKGLTGNPQVCMGDGLVHTWTIQDGLVQSTG